MINAETWWNIIARYNNDIFPIQIIIMALGIVLTCFLFFKPGIKINIMMKAYLSFTFAWSGIVFFLIFGRELPGIFLGVPLFLLVAILFALDIFINKTKFKISELKWQRYLTLFFVFISFLYPFIGFVFGHYYPRSCILGAAPCPTTSFALALLASSLPEVDKKVYILLLVWALPAVGKCFGALDLYEDCILFWVGIYALIMLIKNWKFIRK
jgi:hypothetical protein